MTEETSLAPVAEELPALTLLEITEAGLQRDPDNFYTHDQRNKDMIGMSVDEVGFGRSIVIDENRKVLAGNGTEEQAELRPGTKVLIVKADRNTLVAVQRTDLTEFEKHRLALLDNRAADLHKIDSKAVNRVAAQHPGQLLLDGAFNPKEQVRLLKAQADAQPLAAGGAEPEGGDDKTEVTRMPGSNTVMLSLFLTTETHPEIVRMVRKLGALLEQTTTTGTIEAVVRKAYADWIDGPEQAAVAVAAAAGAGTGNTNEPGALHIEE